MTPSDTYRSFENIIWSTLGNMAEDVRILGAFLGTYIIMTSDKSFFGQI